MPAATLAVLFAILAPPTAGGRVVYSQNFDDVPGTLYPEWVSSPTRHEARDGKKPRGTLAPAPLTSAESPRGKRRFLGEFGGPKVDPTAGTRVRQSVRLSLEKLPAHDTVTVEFDLLVLKSWDGNSPQYGPDRFALTVVGGPKLIDTTFSNNPKVATEKSYQDYPKPHSPPHAGAAQVDRLGYDFFGDSLYRLRFAFPHRGSTLGLDFSSDLFEGKGTGDESWGLDNVTVTVSSRPTDRQN